MTRPLWVDPDERTFPTLDSDLSVDVAVVGAGLSGVGAAWQLREAGLSVAVLEGRTAGSGASGRNGGFVLAGPARPFHEVEAVLGPEAALEVWRFTLANNRLMADLVDTLDVQCGYLRRGSMSLAVDEAEMDEIRRTAESLARAGVRHVLLDAADLPVPFDRLYAGGIYYPGNAEMNSGAFCRGLLGTLAARVHVFEDTPVRRLTHDGVWHLATGEANVHAGAVVLCTNAYTSRLLPGIPISPVRGQVLATEPLDRVVVPCPMYADHGYHYWRQTDAGHLVVGGWRNLDIAAETGTEEELHPGIQRALDAFARRITGRDPSDPLRWAGIMGFTPDMFPLVGRVPGRPGLAMAAGFSGHGVPMAFTCGMQAARAAIGESPAIPEAFHSARFEHTAVGIA